MENKTNQRRTAIPTELHGLNSKIILSFSFQNFTYIVKLMYLNLIKKFK